MENYKDIPKYEGYYQVSNMGNVRSVERHIVRNDGVKQFYSSRVLKGIINSRGYSLTSLSKDGKVKVISTHMIVAMVFLGHSPSRAIVVDHIDNIKTNNRLDNLQIITAQENVQKYHDSIKHLKD